MTYPFADLTAADFLAQEQSLMPPGTAWTTDPSASLTMLLSGLAVFFSRFHQAAINLIAVEADPYQTTAMLPDWETAFGLPDPCVTDPLTMQQRRNALVARIDAQGGASIAFLIRFAAQLGYTITITEYRPFTCQSRCSDILYDRTWRSFFGVHAPAVTVVPFTSNSACDEPLRSWTNQLLECAIRRIAHAETTPLFFYGD